MRHRRQRKSYSMALTAVSASLVAAYLAAPSYWQWHRAEERQQRLEIVQVDTPSGAVDRRLVHELRDATVSSQSAPIIITYHDIGYNESPYTVTPERFATQMQLIHDAGWTTLTIDQLDGWLDGDPLPPHSVLVTFDDGAKGVWRYADPVLERLGMHAAVFLITGFVGTHQPYYMTWDEIGQLHSSGRWDLQAHTHLGHVEVPVDAAGNQAPFLTSLQWLADQGRKETQQEYHRRVLQDLSECKRQFRAHGLPEPSYFAYPFSAHEGESEETEPLQEIVTSLYRMALLDDALEIRTSSSSDVQAGMIQRMDIVAATSTDLLVDKLEQASPIDPKASRPFADPTGWVDGTNNPAPVDLDADTLQINPDPGEEVIRTYAPIRSTMWTDYTIEFDVSGFAPDDWTTAGVTVLKPSRAPFDGNVSQQVDVRIRGNSFGIGRSSKEFTDHPLLQGNSHHVVIDVTTQQVTVSVDGDISQVIELDSSRSRGVGGGVSFWAYRQSEASPPIVFSNLTIR